MNLTFYKYQGTGNDFILIDNRSLFLDKNNITDLVAKLCHRRFGIGADGLMLLENHDHFPFEMIYYNSDGSTSTMCGNGGRCIVAFAAFLNIVNKGEKFTFLAVDGPHDAIIKTDTVALAMQDLDINTIQKFNNAFILNTGSPHYVHFVENIATCNIMEEGKAIRYSAPFAAKGINVNFVQQPTQNKAQLLNIATYERGVEAPTYSCGTGATAVALIQNFHNNALSPIQLQTQGGILTVSFEKQDHYYKNIWLEGPALFVYEGSMVI